MASDIQSIDRLREIAQQWFLSEPLLFAAWTTHQIVSNGNIATLRSGRGRIEVNPEFIESLDAKTLKIVLKFEVIRIILKHPYERRKTSSELSYEASNLAVQECMRLALPMPLAAERFACQTHDRKSFEYYYQLLLGNAASERRKSPALPRKLGDVDSRLRQREPSEHGAADAFCSSQTSSICSGTDTGVSADNVVSGNLTSPHDGGELSCESNSSSLDILPPNQLEPRVISDLSTYCDHELAGPENATTWDHDTFISERINEVIAEVHATSRWGTIAGVTQEIILATLRPRLDYRRMLKAFRASILSSRRRLTRMKPSRRYEFQYMGSRPEFSTRLLFAVDVSGSVGSHDVRSAFSIINQLFKYGIESIDVIWFDTKIRNEEPLNIKRAFRQFSVTGRGGTNFQPLMSYLDKHRDYDGLIIFTDGVAPAPTPPQGNHRTRIAWLFNSEQSWDVRGEQLAAQGMLTAFVQADS